MTIRVELPRQIDTQLAAEIIKESVYVSPYLERLSVDDGFHGITAEITDASRKEEVEGKLSRFLDAMLKSQHSFETRVFVETKRRDTGDYESDIHAKLLSRGWLYDYGQGCSALNGPLLNLANHIDSYARQLYHRSFDVVDREFPVLISADVLWKCGYFDSHPNAACFVGHVVDDFDAIEEFRSENAKSDRVNLPAKEHLHMPGMCLNPAACFPCYPSLSGEEVPEGGKVLSWKGRVFRHESKNVAGLDRLWEFNVREIVFVGSDAYVAKQREKVLPLVAELTEHLDLDCRVETAADPFFATVAAAKTFWQRAQEVKNEIMIPVGYRPDGAERRIACGSVNLHGNFFGHRFDFMCDGESAFTACVGLGIERLVLAAFAQHGFDPQRWPKDVRKIVFPE